MMNDWIKQEIFRIENPNIVIKCVKKKEVKDTKQFSETKQLIKELGIAKMVSSITGRTKENHPGKAAQAEKKRKLPLDQHPVLIMMKEKKILAKEIQSYFNDLGFEIGQDQINKIYRAYNECQTKKK